MELEVKGCSDCPLVEGWTLNYFYCQMYAKGGRIIRHDKNDMPITPAWCPLKTEPIIITINQTFK